MTFWSKTLVLAPGLALAATLGGCGADKVPPDVRTPATHIEFAEKSFPKGAGKPAEEHRVGIWLELRGRQITKMYSRVTTAAGAEVEETGWDARHPKEFRTRDWATCQDTVELPPEPRLNTLDDLLGDLLGPRVRPPTARSLPARSVWEIKQETGLLRVSERGPAYTDREIATYGPSGELAGRISAVRLGTVDRLPEWIQGWSACPTSSPTQ